MAIASNIVSQIKLHQHHGLYAYMSNGTNGLRCLNQIDMLRITNNKLNNNFNEGNERTGRREKSSHCVCCMLDGHGIDLRVSRGRSMEQNWWTWGCAWRAPSSHGENRGDVMLPLPMLLVLVCASWDTSATVEMRVGDKTETVRFYHNYKRGVDRVFVDHPMFLEKLHILSFRLHTFLNYKKCGEKQPQKFMALRQDKITKIINFDSASCALCYPYIYNQILLSIKT